MSAMFSVMLLLSFDVTGLFIGTAGVLIREGITIAVWIGIGTDIVASEVVDAVGSVVFVFSLVSGGEVWSLTSDSGFFGTEGRGDTVLSAVNIVEKEVDPGGVESTWVSSDSVVVVWSSSDFAC